jgi:hypothetical protein
VHAGVDGEGGFVDVARAFDDFAAFVDENEVGDADVSEMHAEGVDPEAIGMFGVACGDVAGDAFAETEFGEEAEGGGETLLAVKAFFGRGGEGGRFRCAGDFDLGGEGGFRHGNLDGGYGRVDCSPAGVRDAGGQIIR